VPALLPALLPAHHVCPTACSPCLHCCLPLSHQLPSSDGGMLSPGWSGAEPPAPNPRIKNENEKKKKPQLFEISFK